MSDDFESKRIECPNCGMPFDVPTEVDRWSCDCGASWELDPRTDGGSSAKTPVIDELREKYPNGRPELWKWTPPEVGPQEGTTTCVICGSWGIADRSAVIRAEGADREFVCSECWGELNR